MSERLLEKRRLRLANLQQARHNLRHHQPTRDRYGEEQPFRRSGGRVVLLMLLHEAPHHGTLGFARPACPPDRRGSRRARRKSLR